MENEDTRPPSKSQRKRDMHQLQELGEKLVLLKKSQLDTIPLDDQLRKAIDEVNRIHQREAKRRLLQYIGKLMRGADIETIQLAYDKLQPDSLVTKNTLHMLEGWRERLLREGDECIGDLLLSFPKADTQHVRKLVRDCHREQEQGSAPVSSRKLFQYLKGFVD